MSDIAPMSGGKVHFHEEQRLRQWWVLTLVALAAFAAWFIPVQGILFGALEGTIDIAITFLVWVLAGALLPSLILALKLETDVRSDGVYVRYFPFHFQHKRIGWEEVERLEAIEYRPILDYGGYGIRYGRKGKAYNVSGRKGIMFSFRDGRRGLLIGTQHPVEFVSATRKARMIARG